MIEIDSPQYVFARLADDKAKLCVVDASTTNPKPRVAIVIAEGDKLIGWCAKGVGGAFLQDGRLAEFTPEKTEHAEQALLEKLNGTDLSGATA